LSYRIVQCSIPDVRKRSFIGEVKPSGLFEYPYQSSGGLEEF
jgi:hypothetical protein